MTDISNDNCINLYFHCGKCLPDKPDYITPMEWSKVQAGFTPLGIQVWCNRCDCNIMHVDFQGEHHPANLTRKATEDDRDRTIT